MKELHLFIKIAATQSTISLAKQVLQCGNTAAMSEVLLPKENCISDVGVLWSNSQVSDDYYIATIILHSYVRRMNSSAYAFVLSLGLSDNLRMYIVDKQITGLPYWDVVDKVISNIKQSPASLLDAQQMFRYRQKYYKVLAEKVPRVVYVHASVR